MPASPSRRSAAGLVATPPWSGGMGAPQVGTLPLATHLGCNFGYWMSLLGSVGNGRFWPNPGRMQPEAARKQLEAVRSHQKQPGAGRSSQKHPGAARTSQKQPGAARRSQEQPEEARSSQEQPKAARSSLPQEARDKEPGGARKPETKSQGGQEARDKKPGSQRQSPGFRVYTFVIATSVCVITS